jgi:predicted short-subunit dehydrogenase-like oxidoreductase (DUF2520 family)
MDVTIVGAGRLGTALAKALKAKGIHVTGPLQRGDTIGGKVVVLAVPDREIVNVAKVVPRESIIGHTAGAVKLDVLGKRESVSMHPLMTAGIGAADFHGATAAIAGTTERARKVARGLAIALGMQPIEVSDEERVAYHAAASIAANFLVTLETIAERVGERAGVNRRHLLPLARAALENWASLGPVALTGPIARGDDAIVKKHRAEIRKHAPEFLSAWDALAKATKRIVLEESARSSRASGQFKSRASGQFKPRASGQFKHRPSGPVKK